MSSYETEELDRLEPAYLANYGLSQSPFSNLHDDAFLYLDAERAQRLNLLQHMTQYSNLLLIVQGEHGVGKTSLLTRFIKNAEDNWEVCEVTANTLMDAGLLMFQIAQGFGLQTLPQDSGELQEMLYAQIAKLHHQDEIPILVIDDAHALSREALLAIFHLADTQVEDAHLLRIILFAEPQIEKILNAKDFRAFRERITHTMEIPPLDEDTTAEYLKHRMAVAGFNGGSPFTPRMIKRIYKASGGIPEQINQLAHETLDKGDFAREEDDSIAVAAKPPLQFKRYRLIGVAIALVALILVFHYLFEDSPTKTTTLQIPLAQKTVPESPQQTAAPVTTPPPPQVNSTSVEPTQTEVTPTPTPEASPPVQQKIIPLQLPSTEATEQAAVSPSAESTSQQADTTAATMDTAETPAQQQPESKSVQAKLQSVTPDPLPASDEQQTMILNGEGFTARTRVFVSWADRDLEIPAARVKRISDTQLQVLLTVGTQHDYWKVHVVDPKHGNSNTLAFTVATPALLKKKIQDRVLAREPGSFTLQLFGSHDQKNAEAFIQQHKLDEQASYFMSERKGSTWYSVIYGDYPDQAAARAAIKTLPATLKKIKPWVRRYDDIQASINATRQLKRQKPKQQQTIALPKSTSVFTTTIPKQGDIKQYESWIWSQDPSNFTLQLMGSRDIAAAERFVQAHKNLDGAIYFHTRHDGRDWYAVIFGVYPDKQKARAAIKRLPVSLQKSSPWIRSYASIHAELSRTE